MLLLSRNMALEFQGNDLLHNALKTFLIKNGG
jgi:hypothetical protein